MVDGQHHHVSARYLAQYAKEAAWKEDRRRQSNGTQLAVTLKLALAAPIRGAWKGYWQR